MIVDRPREDLHFDLRCFSCAFFFPGARASRSCGLGWHGWQGWADFDSPHTAASIVDGPPSDIEQGQHLVQHTIARMSDSSAEDHVGGDRDEDEQRDSLFHRRRGAARRIVLHRTNAVRTTLYVRALLSTCPIRTYPRTYVRIGS